MDFHKIIKTRDSAFPQFEFEFHPATGKVYVVGLPGRFAGGAFVPAEGGPAKWVELAEHCDHHARFLSFVKVYLRGHRQGRYDQLKLVESQSSHVETTCGKVG